MQEERHLSIDKKYPIVYYNYENISQILMVCLLCARRYYWRYKNNYTPGLMPSDTIRHIYIYIQLILNKCLLCKFCTLFRKLVLVGEKRNS